MTAAFDPRIVRVTIEIDGTVQEFTNVRIDARGTKYRSALMSQAEIRIFNLTRENQQWILTRASPQQKPPAPLTPINVTLEVGRESYGTFTLFQGSAFAAGITQPPDMGIVLQSLTNNFQLANTSAVSFPETSTLGQIAGQLAKDMGCTLQMRSENPARQIVNYSFTGSTQKQMQRLNEMGVIAHIDNKTLIIVDPEQSRSTGVILIDSLGGLVGVPQATSSGAACKTMIERGIEVGGEIELISQLNPAANGNYIIQQLDFELSNRDQPFFYNLDCLNKAFFTGTQ